MARKRIEANLSTWASELGMAIQTISRKLVKNGLSTDPGDLITARDLFRCLYDQREEALTRQALASAEEMERENKRADNLLVDLPVAEKELWQRILLPLKTEIDLCADKVASLANPDNPDQAHRVLTEWAEQVKKQISEATNKQETKTKKKK